MSNTLYLSTEITKGTFSPEWPFNNTFIKIRTVPNKIQNSDIANFNKCDLFKSAMHKYHLCQHYMFNLFYHFGFDDPGSCFYRLFRFIYHVMHTCCKINTMHRICYLPCGDRMQWYVPMHNICIVLLLIGSRKWSRYRIIIQINIRHNASKPK